jgi:hypothetical protein
MIDPFATDFELILFGEKHDKVAIPKTPEA